MNIRLDLSRHCIETALKRLHEQSVRSCLKGTGTGEEVLSVTRSLLESVDLGRLRSRHPALAGGSHDRVLLSVSSNHAAVWVEDQLVDTFRLEPSEEL